MKRALLAGAAILGVLASATVAQAAGDSYARIELGLAQSPDLTIGPASFNIDSGYSFGGAFGWQISGPLTLEIEGVYTESRVENRNSEIGAFSAMANLLVDVHKWENGSGFFAGLGLGMNQVTLSANGWPGFVPPLHSDSDFVFAVQGIVGVEHKWGDLDMQLRYKYNTAVDDASLQVRSVPVTVWETEWSTHSLSLSLLFDL